LAEGFPMTAGVAVGDACTDGMETGAAVASGVAMGVNGAIGSAFAEGDEAPPARLRSEKLFSGVLPERHPPSHASEAHASTKGSAEA
jgi:hypothetical protein